MLDNIDLMKYWLKSAENDYEAMQVMFSNKKNTWTLFLGHLVIEKLLKGLYAKGTENEDSDIDIAIISSDFKDIIDDGAKLIGLTWKIDTRIEPHPILTEDYENISNPFVKEIVDTGIKVA